MADDRRPLWFDPLQNVVDINPLKEENGGIPPKPDGCLHTPYAWEVHYKVAIAQKNALGDYNWGGPGSSMPPFPIVAESFDWWEYMDCKSVPDVEWETTAPDQVCAAHAFVFLVIPGVTKCSVSDAGCAGLYPQVTTHPECFTGTTGTATSPPTQGVGSLVPPSS